MADNSGPLEKRIVSKNWSVRAGAYEELTQKCKDSQHGSKADFFKDHISEWKIYLKDSNPGALEKCLTCLAAFLDKVHRTLITPEIQNPIITMLVDKCLGHMKPVIKQKGSECLILLFEVSENFEESIDTLSEVITHKNVKVMQSGCIAVAALLEAFGLKKVNIKHYSEQMLKNAGNTNPGVKNAAYDYYKAVYKWMGDAMLPQIDSLKKTQIDDLKKLFAEVKEKGDKSLRLVRTEKAQAEEDAKNKQIDAAMAEEEKVPEIDPLEFAPEKDILTQFGVEWQEEVSKLAKWQERKAKLEELAAACANVKVKAGNTDDIANFLKKECANANVNVAMGAISAATAIVNGMKKGFEAGIKILFAAILLKYKEKRQMVLAEVDKFVEATIKVVGMDFLADEFIPLITNIAPGVKSGTIKYVEQAALVNYIDVLQRIQDSLLPAMVKAIEDKDGGVRDGALHCMGILKGRLGESVLDKYLKSVNEQKKAKINDAAQEVKPSKYDRPENYKPPAPKPKKVQNDELMMDAEVKPKKRPPPNIGQKPVKKKPAEDAEMKIEEVKAPQPKKPVISTSDRPKTAAAPYKAPSGPIVQEEDVGSGLSKEEAIAKVEEFFDSGTVKKFDDAKWQVKAEAFTDLQNEILEKQAPPDLVEAAAKFVKAKMKDWKESNLNLLKAIVALFAFITTNCERVNKRTIHCAMSFFVDKIGDIKMSVAIKEMLMNASELVTPKYISMQIIKYAATAKAPNTLKDSCLQLADMLDQFGPSAISLKETIDFGKMAAAHATPAVRQAAMKLFCEIYKHVGDIIKNFTGDIKESTLKLIDAELAKTPTYARGEFKAQRFVKGAAQEEEKSGKGPAKNEENDLLAGLPREDISKKLNSKLMEQFQHKDWKIRKKGGDDVEAILRDAGMRIEPNGLGDLMDAMKKGMKDPNKAVVKVYILLLGVLAEAIGAPIKQFAKKCFVPMVANISNKATLVREDVVNTMNKWAAAVGPELIINYLQPQLTLENPESRTECFKWISEHKDAIPQSDVNGLVKPLVLCLTDKSKAIRESSMSIIEEVMPIVGYQEFLNGTQDMNTATKQTLKPILEKLKNQMGTAAGPAQEQIKPKAEPPAAVEDKKPVQNSFAKAAVDKKRDASPVLQKKDAANRHREHDRQPSAGRKAAGQDDDEPKINVLNKAKRQQLDQRNKWPLQEVKGDHIDKLQHQCMDAFGTKMHDLMWAKSQDFQKHIKCVEQFGKFIETQPGQIVEVMDIMFKWANVKLNESSNTKLLVSLFDFFAKLLEFLHKTACPLEDFEIAVLLGTLCEKVGSNNKILVDKIRNLIRMCFDVYDQKLCYRIIIETGVKAKNLKSVAENLDEVAEFISSRKGIDCCTKKDFDLFLVCVDSPDKGVREGSLKVFAEAYVEMGEDVWRLIKKDVPLKVKGLLEQRFKQVAKKNLAMSLNSAKAGQEKKEKKDPLSLTGTGSAIKRSSVNPAMSHKLVGLKFNKPSDYKEKEAEKVEKSSSSNASMKDSERDVTDQLNNMAIAKDEEVKIEQAANQDVEMEDAAVPKLSKNPQSFNPAEDKDKEQRVPPIEVKVGQPQENNAAMDAELDEQYSKLDHILETDPVLKKQTEFIMQHISQLKIGDLLKRVDSLVALNELISAAGSNNGEELTQDQQNQQQALIKCCNELISAFTHVMNDIFSYPVNDIPLRFTKYFITIVNKTCASKEIMREVNEKQVFNIAEQLLTRLLIENLDKIGQNKEGELILKNLNSAMLRMLENCNHTYIFVVLFSLLTSYKDDRTKPKLAGLIIKCLLKLSKIMDKLIEKIDLSKFLVSIHEYMAAIDHDNKSQNDDLGIRIVKTLVNEVVKLKKDQIWGPYQVVENHAKPDNHIKKWVQIILRSLPNAQESSTLPTPAAIPVEEQQQKVEPPKPQQSRMYIEFEIKKIISDIKDQSKNEAAIQKLDRFSKQNPDYDFSKNLNKESEQFASRVMFQLEQFRNGSSWRSTNSDSHNASGKQDKMDQLKQKLNAVNQSAGLKSSEPQNKMSAFESKMAKFQEKKQSVNQSMMPPTTQARQSTGAANNLNTSFSVLNNNLSQKWAAINSGQKKVGGLTGRPQTANTQLAQTITSNAVNPLNTSHNKFQSKMGLMNKMKSNPSNAVVQQPNTGIIGEKPKVASAIPQAPASASKGGISQNSFRSRLQGMNAGAGSSAPDQNAQDSASNQDLQKRLADMKAKLQGLNNKK